MHVSTLHSLALKSLRSAGLLVQYPTDPVVLDDWELERIFDDEFGCAANINSKPRREAIRRLHEAFWSTGLWNPPNYFPPRPPITPVETSRFSSFLASRAQLYSCVLPGELVRKCVVEANAGTIDLASLLDLSHLIVDEYQDLNPVDLEFVDILAKSGITLFVAGDDDQSIYSFRHAAPSGIQDFLAKSVAERLDVLRRERIRS